MSPRREAIKREIEAEMRRQGFIPNRLQPGGSIDETKLAAAIDRLLHGEQP
jgi:hypothetical protein